MRPRWIRAAITTVLVASSVLVLRAQPVFTLPLYAARTGMDCRSCHFDPNGGGPRNEMGFLYARQRHDLTPDPNPRWTEGASLNRVGDALYVGTNTRALYLYSSRQGSGTTDISTFFQMQGALHVTLSPHKNLAVVMSRDFGEFSGDRTRDLFGMVQEAGGRFYLKAGRIRGLFGLRQDDHTAGTRAGFLRASSGGTSGLLPFDPRDVDSGVEAGASVGSVSLALALTNGGAAFANRAQTASAKVMATSPWGQVATSIYDSFESSSGRRFTRWGGYALMRFPGLPDLDLLGEAGFGTDDDGDGRKSNQVAAYVEADYRISRAFLVRAKYDFVDVHRGAAGNASERFSVEGDVTLVPFADLKLSYRRIVPETTADENEVLAMWHFYF